MTLRPDIADALDVLYRNERLIAVAKPSGMLVHRGWDNDPVTAADIVRDRLVGGSQVFAIHRLDRATSGVLLFALDRETARHMQQELQSPDTIKRYIALVRGPMLKPCLLDHTIPMRESDKRVDAITQFTPLAHKDRWSLVVAEPKTGRLHQIRRHLKHLSHPVVGDVRYGKGDINRLFREQYKLHRLALHAFSFQFNHVDGGSIKVQAPLPADLREPLLALGILSDIKEELC